MSALVRWVVASSALSAIAGAAGAVAASRALSIPEVRDAGDLPDFEDRFVREFGVPEGKREIVRAVLREYRTRRREIEGQAAAAASAKLVQAGREVDDKLLRILPPPQREAYRHWNARGTDPSQSK